MVRKYKSAFLGFAVAVILLILLFAFGLPAEVQGRMEPVTADRPDFGLGNVVVTVDERVFTLFAALNAAGHDREYPGMEMSPVRQTVRAELASKDLPSLARLKPTFDRVADYHLVVWVLQRGEPPGFGRAESSWSVSTRAAEFAGLANALGDFYMEADIPSLLEQVEPDMQADMQRWQRLADDSLVNILAYLKTSEIPFRQLVVIPNPLDAHYSGNGPQIGDTAYVVAGPTETDANLRGLIEHEALHSFIGPMLDRQMDVISGTQSRQLWRALRQEMPGSYGTWESAVEETLNRAINLRMLPDTTLRARQLDRLEAEGFLFIHPMDQALAVYEQSGQPFESYLSTLLQTFVQLASGE